MLRLFVALALPALVKTQLATLAGGTVAKLPPDVTLMGAVVLSQLLKILLPDDLSFLKRKP